MQTKTNDKSCPVTIKCPFFHSENFNSVICEGCIKDSSVRFIFPNKSEKGQWQKKYCTNLNTYSSCPICRIADEKYAV